MEVGVEGPSQKIKLLVILISWFLSLQIGLTKIFTKGFGQILLRTLSNGGKTDKLGSFCKKPDFYRDST